MDVVRTITQLKQHYPHAKYYLHFSNPLELMIAAILSAQVKDTAVNAATSALFKKYRTAHAYANADVEELISYVKGITFAGTKARNIKKACQLLVERHGGNVPDTMDELVALPGIGRKTANAVLINGFNKTVGIPVDTHVMRLAYRFGWTKQKDADKIEQDLMQIIPKTTWKKIGSLLKDHGRAICTAPVPSCSHCFLKNACPKQGVTRH